jgi:uncharacterized protein (DUF736 family)
MARIDRAGALWLKTDKNGNKFLSGVIERDKIPQGGNVRITIFKNKSKSKDTHPDYHIFLDESIPKLSPKDEPKIPRDDDVPF